MNFNDGYRDYKTYQRQREGIYEFLDRYEWEWFCSLNFAGYNSSSANVYVREFVRQIGLREHKRVCSAGVLIPSCNQ